MVIGWSNKGSNREIEVLFVTKSGSFSTKGGILLQRGWKIERHNYIEWNTEERCAVNNLESQAGYWGDIFRLPAATRCPFKSSFID